MGRFAEILLAWRWPVLLIGLLAVVASAWAVPQVGFSMSISPLIEGGAEEKRKRILAFESEVPPPRYHYVGIVTWPERIGRAQLDALSELHDRLLADDRILSVTSLPRVRVLEPGAFFPRPFAHVVGDRDVVAAAQAHPLLHRRLISVDGRSTCLLIMASRPDDREAVVDWLNASVPDMLGDTAEFALLSGYTAQRARRAYMQEDLRLLVGLELLMAIVILPFVFRSVRGVVLPLVAVVAAVLVNFGVLHAVGGTLGIIELAIPGLIILIGLSDAVHMVHRFEEALAHGASARAAVVKMCEDVGVACFITSLTTAIGFLSLQIAEHGPVREFGLKAACAVFLTFAVTMTAIPLGLAFCRPKRGILPRFLSIDRLDYGRPRLVALCSLAVAAFAVLGIAKVEVNARWLEELPDHDPHKARTAFLDEQFSGVLDIQARVTGDLGSPAAFRALERFQKAMMDAPGVLWCESITHWVREVSGNPPGALSDRQVIRGRLIVAGLGDYFPSHVVRRDFRKGRVTFLTANLASSDYLALRDRLEALGREHAPDLDVEATGYTLMAHESGVRVAETLLESLALTVLTITILISVIFRSLRLGLISVLPNVIPVLLALAVNGWLGIPLRVGIVMIYCLGLGLAVDDTIHMLTRFVQERTRHPDAPVRDAVVVSLRTAGVALIVTSIILVAGGLCFLPANFQSIHDVGLLLTVIVSSALVADLFVLPLLLERFAEPRR